MAGELTSPKKTVLGVEENIEAALCYILWFVTGILFLIVEKDSKFVRFHALQSIATFVPLYILSALIPLLGNPFITVPLSILLSIASLALWVLLIYNAYRGEKYKLPVVGEIAEKYS